MKLSPRRRKAFRRLWHLWGGAFFPALGLAWPAAPLLPLVALVTALILALDWLRLRYPPLQQAIASLVAVKGREARGLSAASYLALATLLCFLLFPREIAIAALLFLATGDPAAAWVGERWGRPLGRGRGKSLAGSLAFLGAAGAVGASLSFGAGFSPGVMASGALAAALVELLSLPPDDNLTVPLASGGIMTLVAWQGG